MGYFNFGFPEGNQQFVINDADTVTIPILAHQDNNYDVYIDNNLIQGDINQDNLLDILDVVIIINIILNNYDPSQTELWSADMNHDGNINIQDVILIIQLILNN